MEGSEQAGDFRSFIPNSSLENESESTNYLC